MYDKLNLSNVCKGAAEELFADQLNKVLTNIKDPSTDAEKKRTITLTFTFAPIKDRSSANVSCTAKSTLVPVLPVVAPIVLTGEGLAVQGYQPTFDQQSMFEMSKPVAVSQ